MILNRLPMSGKKIKISDCTITQSGTLTYNGSNQEASFTVKYNNVTLTEGVDYTRSHTQGLHAASSASSDSLTKYYETFTGIGKYTGTKSVAFTISRKSISPGGSITYNPYITELKNQLNNGADSVYSDVTMKCKDSSLYGYDTSLSKSGSSLNISPSNRQFGTGTITLRLTFTYVQNGATAFTSKAYFRSRDEFGTFQTSNSINVTR